MANEKYEQMALDAIFDRDVVICGVPGCDREIDAVKVRKGLINAFSGRLEGTFGKRPNLDEVTIGGLADLGGIICAKCAYEAREHDGNTAMFKFLLTVEKLLLLPWIQRMKQEEIDRERDQYFKRFRKNGQNGVPLTLIQGGRPSRQDRRAMSANG